MKYGESFFDTIQNTERDKFVPPGLAACHAVVSFLYPGGCRGVFSADPRNAYAPEDGLLYDPDRRVFEIFTPEYRRRKELKMTVYGGQHVKRKH